MEPAQFDFSGTRGRNNTILFNFSRIKIRSTNSSQILKKRKELQSLMQQSLAMCSSNVVALQVFLLTLLMLPWVSLSDCSSQTTSLFANNSALTVAQENVIAYADQLCSQDEPNDFCFWVNQTNSFSITYNFTQIQSNYNYTNFSTACRNAAGNFCEISYTATLRNSTNYFDDDSWYDDDAIVDDDYYASGSTNKTLFLVFICSPWCFAKNACDVMGINAYIQVQTKMFYGGAVGSFNLMGTSCSLF